MPATSEQLGCSLKIGVVDLFCGVGGLSLGLKDSGMSILAGIDIDELCRLPFERNVGSTFVERDVADVTEAEIASLFQGVNIRVLAACAPCQPFSGYTTRRQSSDDRWRLLLEVLRLTSGVRPELITVENVPRLSRLPLWTRFVSQLADLGYHLSWKVLDSSEYGVPQRRLRLVLVASLLGPIDLAGLRKSSKTSVRDAISHLPPIEAGQRNNVDALHSARALTPRNLKRIRASRPSGTWKEWPKKLRAECHTRSTGQTYPSVYGRMSWEQPAPTMTTQFYGFGNGRFGHPDQDRAITLREGAILQSFPETFVFLEPHVKRINFRAIGRLIGNAVPPKLVSSIGEFLVAHATSSAGAFSRKSSASK